MPVKFRNINGDYVDVSHIYPDGIPYVELDEQEQLTCCGKGKVNNMNTNDLNSFLEKSNKKLAFYEKAFNICIAVVVISNLVTLIFLTCRFFGIL